MIVTYVGEHVTAMMSNYAVKLQISGVDKLHVHEMYIHTSAKTLKLLSGKNLGIWESCQMFSDR